MRVFPNNSLAGLGLAMALTGVACSTTSPDSMGPSTASRLAGSIVLVDQASRALELVDKAGTRFTIKAVGLPSISTITGPKDAAHLAYFFPEADPAAFVRPQGDVDLLIGYNYRHLMPDGGRFVGQLCLANTQFGTGHISVVPI